MIGGLWAPLIDAVPFHDSYLAPVLSDYRFVYLISLHLEFDHRTKAFRYKVDKKNVKNRLKVYEIFTHV